MIYAALYNWLPVASLLGAGCFSLPRAWKMWRQGTFVLAADRQRTCKQVVSDTILVAALFAWGYCVLARTGVLSIAILPAWLCARILDHLGFKLCGSALLIGWVIIYVLGVRALGDAWRLGIDRERPGPLATSGIFRWSRNPIYLAFDLLFLGTFLWDGRLVFLLLAAVLATMLHGVILREERFLEESFGDAFHTYRSQVGRYVSVAERLTTRPI